MAIESLDLTLREFGPPVYVYHEIVHNKYVVESFKSKGAIFVDHLEEVPEKSVLRELVATSTVVMDIAGRSVDSPR